MDDPVNGRAAASFVALLGLGLAMPCIAQALVDPTRPPYLGALPEAQATETAATPVLQAILLSPERRFAFIDGKGVQVGDAVGEAKIVAIEMDRVKLRDPAGHETEMRLVPEIPLSRRPAREPNAPRRDPR